MLKIENKSLNLNAISMIDEENVARFCANHYGAGVDFSYVIENAVAHLEHQEQVDADFDAFKAHVMQIIGAMSEASGEAEVEV